MCAIGRRLPGGIASGVGLLRKRPIEQERQHRLAAGAWASHWARQAERLLASGHRMADDDFIFADSAGEPLWGRHVTTLSLKALLRRAGLPSIRFHDLRHTFATLQLAAGTNPKIVSEVLGHKEVAITLDRYSHALPTVHTKAMARLDALLGRGGAARAGRHEGSNKGSPNPVKANEGPDPSVDRAEKGEFGTAYRNRGEPPVESD